MKYAILALKGMAFGISNIVPGLTGGAVLIMLGVYEEFVDAVGNLGMGRQRWRRALPFLASLGAGAAVAMVTFASVMSWVLEHHPEPVMFLFMGLLIGTVPSLFRLHGDMRLTRGRAAMSLAGLAVVVAFRVVERLGTLNGGGTSEGAVRGALYLLATSFVAGGANVTPGVSGSYVFLLVGTYGTILEALSALKGLIVRWDTLLPAGIGAVLGIVTFSRVIATAIRRWPAPTYYCILGLLVGSVYGLLPDGWASAHPLSLVIPFLAGMALPMAVSRRRGGATLLEGVG